MANITLQGLDGVDKGRIFRELGTPITIGRRRPGEVEVVNGLKDADRVIIEGTQKVRDRGKVYELSEQTQPAAAAAS